MSKSYAQLLDKRRFDDLMDFLDAEFQVMLMRAIYRHLGKNEIACRNRLGASTYLRTRALSMDS